MQTEANQDNSKNKETLRGNISMLPAPSYFQLSEFSNIHEVGLFSVILFFHELSKSFCKFLGCTPSFREKFYTSILLYMKYPLFCFTLDLSVLHLYYLAILKENEPSVPNFLFPDTHDCVDFCCTFQAIRFETKRVLEYL